MVQGNEICMTVCPKCFTKIDWNNHIPWNDDKNNRVVEDNVDLLDNLEHGICYFLDFLDGHYVKVYVQSDKLHLEHKIKEAAQKRQNNS